MSLWVRVAGFHHTLDSCEVVCARPGTRGGSGPRLCPVSVPVTILPCRPRGPPTPHPGQAWPCRSGWVGRCPQPSLSWRTLPSSECPARRCGRGGGPVSATAWGVWGESSIPFWAPRPSKRACPGVPALWAGDAEPWVCGRGWRWGNLASPGKGGQDGSGAAMLESSGRRLAFFTQQRAEGAARGQCTWHARSNTAIKRNAFPFPPVWRVPTGHRRVGKGRWGPANKGSVHSAQGRGREGLPGRSLQLWRPGRSQGEGERRPWPWAPGAAQAPGEDAPAQAEEASGQPLWLAGA